jgi:hypothetical protein
MYLVENFGILYGFALCGLVAIALVYWLLQRFLKSAINSIANNGLRALAKVGLLILSIGLIAIIAEIAF